MNVFRDPAAASRAKERLEALSGADLSSLFEFSFAKVANPDLALLNLERWLLATGNPPLYVTALEQSPVRAGLLLLILGASQPISDCLVQNPELASLVLEGGVPVLAPTRAQITEEGKRLLASSTSYRHSLDRLRYLRQRWNLMIVVHDLGGTWSQVVIWRALSELADAIIELALHVVWEDQRKKRDLPETCPVMVAGFGKLGGLELNYSSDIDLVYVVPNGLDERVERDCARFAEALGRALSEPMGRGFLYRVDLRLRPYGAAGTIVRSERSIRAYYELYAEAWEVQALLRSRAIAGPDELMVSWEDLRVRTCFRPKLSDFKVEEMLAMRVRIEEESSPDDLKRGKGGIRDIEFVTQAQQLLHGHDHPELRVQPTMAALVSLEEGDFLNSSTAASLRRNYIFLRQLEHRIQLFNDRQTHQIPAQPEAREALAKLMGIEQWSELDRQLQIVRAEVHTCYRQIFGTDGSSHEHRDAVRTALGGLATAGLTWFDVLPASESFYEVLATNQDSLGRVVRILEAAPSLVNSLKASVSLTEKLVSGEVEEDDDPGVALGTLRTDVPLKEVSAVYARGHATLCTRWALSPTFDLSHRLADLGDRLLRHCLARLYADLSVFALGSYAIGQLAPESDFDLLFLVDSVQRQREAETQGQHFLAMLAELRRMGAPVSVDLRLRPDGRKGLLVRSYEGLLQYSDTDMELWERFALGHARLVDGHPEAISAVRDATMHHDRSEASLQELLKMKRRVETERVLPQHAHRNVKLGIGGLNDIEWLVRLQEMWFGTQLGVDRPAALRSRILHLQRGQLLNALEAETLLEAYDFLRNLRIWLHLQGISNDLLPENPSRLDRLASLFGLEDGNVLLAQFREVTETVRSLYIESIERLHP